MNEAVEKLAEGIDKLDNIIAALSLPLPEVLHVACLREALPDLRQMLRDSYRAAGGTAL